MHMVSFLDSMASPVREGILFTMHSALNRVRDDLRLAYSMHGTDAINLVVE